MKYIVGIDIGAPNISRKASEELGKTIETSEVFDLYNNNNEIVKELIAKGLIILLTQEINKL